MRDDQGKAFNQHGGIWLLELQKFYAGSIESEQQRWIKFFRDGEKLDDGALPDWMHTQEMRQAMNTLTTFSEKEHQYHQYQARQEYLREQRTIQLELEQATRALMHAKEREIALQQREAAAKEREIALQQREAAAQQREVAALAEVERLKALLAQKSD